MGRISGILVVATMMLGMAGAAQAGPCFDQTDREVKDKCPSDYRGRQNRDGESLARDEKGITLANAIVVPAKRRNDSPKVGIANAAGQVIVSPQFERVYVVSRGLGVGELTLDPKKYDSQRAFLVDLVTGATRATPYRRIIRTGSFDADTAPYLLGVLPTSALETGDVDVLLPEGTATGLHVKQVNLNLAHAAILTLPYGLVQLAGKPVNVRGEAPAGGRNIVKDAAASWYAEIGPPPKEVQGTHVGALLMPLDSQGEVQSGPPDLVGMIKGGVWMYQIRKTPQGIRFHRHGWGRPKLSEPPAGEGYLDLYVSQWAAVVRTAAGWVDLDGDAGKVFPSAVAAVASSDARRQAVFAAVAADEADRPRREAEARATAQAKAKADHAAKIASIKARIERAKKNELSLGAMMDLKFDVMRYQMEYEWTAAKLPVDAYMKTEVCRARRASFCDPYEPPSTYSGSGFQSTWEKAFENARALNQRQYNENCAANDLGANRICRRY